MLVVTVEAAVADTAQAIALMKNHAPARRDMPGCARYDLYRNTDGDGKILILQHWHSDEAFQAYRNSDAFAGLAAGLKPILAGAPATVISTVIP